MQAASKCNANNSNNSKQNKNTRKRIFSQKWIWQLPKMHTARNEGSHQEVGQHYAGKKCNYGSKNREQTQLK